MRPLLELISRVVGGWNVRMTLAGKRRGRFFADVKFGGKGNALAAAKVYRDELLARRKPRQPTPRPILVARSGSPCYQIRLPKPGGGTTTTEFSLRLHGPRKARRLATEAFYMATKQMQMA